MLKSLQALRAAAALLVVLDHLNYLFARNDPAGISLFTTFRFLGSIGVDTFFAISGFIMVTTNWEAFGTPRAGGRFLLRRIARIYPPYWLVLIPTVLAYLFAKDLMRGHDGNVDLIGSFLLLPQRGLPLLLVSWTLTFEMFFYVIFSRIIGMRRSMLPWTLLIWAVLQIAAAVVLKGSTEPYQRFLSMPFPLEFIAGAFIAYAYRLDRLRYGAVIGLTGFGLALALWGYGAIEGLTANDTTINLSRVTVFGIPAVMMLYGTVALERVRGAGTPSWLVRLGDASYAMYLWHLPIIAIVGATHVFVGVRGFWSESLGECFAIALVVIVSLVVYRYFEQPLTRFLNTKIDDVLGRTRPIVSNAA